KLGAVFCFLLFLFEVLDHLVQQLAGTGARHRGEWVDFSQSEAVENTGLLLQKRVVYLIGDYKNGLFTPAQHIRDGIIQIGDSGGHIHHKQDNRSFFNGNQHLFTDGGFKSVLRAVHVSTGVDHRKLLPYPFSLSVMPVARYSTIVIDNRPAAFCQAIIQSGFPDVWPSYNCDDICHQILFYPLIAFTPGSSLPSMYSSSAPPPVLT